MKNIRFFILLIFSFQACEDAFTSVLEVDLPQHESKLAISAHFTNLDTTLRVFVSNSLGTLDSNAFDVITDAEVRLLKNGVELGNFVYVAENYTYESPNTGIVDSEIAHYELIVSSPKYGLAKAVQEMPSAPRFTEVTFEADAGFTRFGDRANVLSFIFEDNASEANYYMIRAYGFIKREWEEEGSQQNLILFSDDPFVNDGADNRLIFSDGSFNGKKVQIRINTYDSFFDENSSFTALLEHNTLDRYHYLNSLTKNFRSAGDPFTEPVIVHQNVENGHGIFTLGNAVTREVMQ